YRHGSVKYTLTALVTTKGFLGGIQELKVNKVVELKDLINCAQEPYSNSIIVTGSSNTKPATNKPKNFALATITLAKSAYLKGQVISIDIDMSHPNTIQRNPGCWIQLLRMENYHAGEQSKEYTHVVASSTHAIEMDLKHGKILTELTVPEDSIATMSTTKIISIEYKLQILFDMRLRTGFLEGRNRRTVNKKLRAKITGKPGGFEVEVPVVIGTLFDSSHVPGSGIVSSLVSLPGIQPPEIPSSESVRLEHLVSNMHMSSNSEGTQEASHPKMQHQTSHSSFHTIPIAHGRQTEPAFGLATVKGPSSQPTRQHMTQCNLQTASPSAPSPPSATLDLYQEPKALPPLPPDAIPLHPPSPSMSPPPSSSSSSSSHTPSSSLSSYQPPRLPYRANSESSSSSSPISLTTPTGYPNEKLAYMPHQLIPPNAHVVESPTAPQAVSLGLGPASPGIFHRSVSTPGTSSGSSDYFQAVPSKQHSLPLGYGAFASPVGPSPTQGYTPRTTYSPHASTSQHSYTWSASSPSSSSSSSSGSSSSAPLRSLRVMPPPPPPAPAVPRLQTAMNGRGLVTRPESFHPAPPYTPTA
ncbi:hypothetical protein BGZ92_005771, partial [Podila epicladia]